MTKFIRVHYLPWHSKVFTIVAGLGFPFGSLTSLVLSAMAIHHFLGQGGYPSIVMAQEAIILTSVVAPMGLSCVCTCSSSSNAPENSPTLIAQYPLPYMILDLFAFLFRVGTTGFYLKDQYARHYSEKLQDLYILETSAIMIVVLLWVVSFPFSFSFHTPLFKRRGINKHSAEPKLNYRSKQYSIITFIITVESWTEEKTVQKDEEAVSGETPVVQVP